MNTARSQHRGFSLTELLVGLATSMFLLAGVLGMFSSTLASQGASLKQTRLNQELRNIMDLMSRDIRRAGFWELAPYAAQPQGAITLSGTSGSITVTSSAAPFSGIGAGLVGRTLMSSYGAGTITAYNSGPPASITVNVTRPFSQSWINEGSWMISNLFTETANNLAISGDETCVQYTYDRNGDSTVDANEKFAFRLHNGIVQMYAGSGTAPDCSSGAGSWSELSSDTLNITALTFSTDDTTCINLNTAGNCTSPAPSSGDVLLYQREVDITLTGTLANNASVTRTMVEAVRLRNDVITVQ